MDSPRDVPTYDKKPEMSARAAAAAFTEHWRDGDFIFGIINFANPDMVGHTGVIEAAVTAVETVDDCLGEVVEAVEESGGVCVITADHGNADQMLEPDGSPNTAHSMNPVPLIVTADVGELREGGTLVRRGAHDPGAPGRGAAGGDDRKEPDEGRLTLAPGARVRPCGRGSCLTPDPAPSARQASGTPCAGRAARRATSSATRDRGRPPGSQRRAGQAQEAEP